MISPCELLERGYGDFINEPYLETDEFTRVDPAKPRAGPMFANIGAYLTSLLFGFTGIRMGSGMPEQWPDRAVVMPSGWRAIRVERLRVRGEERSLVARLGARAELVWARVDDPAPLLTPTSCPPPDAGPVAPLRTEVSSRLRSAAAASR